jgi:type IV pilus assembly protein PilN
MIRINLLPIKQDRRREAGRNQVLIGLLVLILELACFVLLYFDADADVDEQRNANQTIQAKVKRIEKQVKDHQRILQEIEEYEKRQQAIESLQAARTGPVYVMLEISNVLSKGGRPHIDHDRYQGMIQTNPAAGYDENWDHRRLWIDTFQEKDRLVRITGQGMTHEDVAEFIRRVNLSDFFTSTELVSTNLDLPKITMEGFDQKSTDPLVHFVMTARVKYQ